MIPYGSHSLDQDDIDAVVDVLQNQFLTQGEQVPKFEAALRHATGARFATAVNSGTSALHVACMALDVGPGDMIWTSPNSFVASANCGRYCGADIDFVDIDPVTRNMCVHKLEDKLARAAQHGMLPKVLIPVHFGGLSCPMQEIREITKRYGIKIIEDASHALGASYNGQPVGNCAYSDACVLSFHPVKPVTTAEGGAVLTNNEMIQHRVIQFAKHGIVRDKEHLQRPIQGPWYYEQQQLGFNYRMSDIHAALGVSQLSKLEAFTLRRQHLAKRYFSLLASASLTLPDKKGLSESAWHLFPIEVSSQKRAHIFTRLQEAGIGVNVHYIPIHLQPYYRGLGFAEGDFPNAEQYYSGAITLPLFPAMTDEQQSFVAETLDQILSG